MSNTHYVSAPFTVVDIDIARDENWFDPVPQLLDEADDPVDLAGKTLRLYVRPTFDHSVLIYEFNSGGGGSGGISIDNAALGYFTIAVPRDSVIALLPVGEWDQFLVLSDASADPEHIEIWRGKLRVHPGRITA